MHAQSVVVLLLLALSLGVSLALATVILSSSFLSSVRTDAKFKHIKPVVFNEFTDTGYWRREEVYSQHNTDSLAGNIQLV